MRKKQGFRALVALALGAAAPLAAAAPTTAPLYRFEPAGRAVLAPAGVVFSRDPKLGRRASGAIYLLALYGAPEPSHLGLAVSEDGGDSFAAPVPISESGAAVSSHGENSPSLAISSSGGMYALWEQRRSDDGTDLMFARSINYGRSFEKPIWVTDKTIPSSNGFSFLAVAPGGAIYAVWLDGRNRQAGPPGTSAVYLARSTDRGATFSKNIQVATGACPCCRPTLAFAQSGEVFVAWRTVLPGNIRDMVVATSTDQGESFGAPVRVATDNWKIEGCPHSGPVMAVQGERLFIAWFSEGDGSTPGVRVTWTQDGGKTFATPLIASGKVLDANHPALTASEDGRLLLVFHGRDPAKQEGWGPLWAYLAEVNETGRISPPQRVPGRQQSVTYPTVLAGTLGRVFIAWGEIGEKGSQIVMSRGRRSSSPVGAQSQARTARTEIAHPRR